MDSTCPSCGGSGGGPFGPPGSAWDRDDYRCPRCAGAGVLEVAPPSEGPEVAKTQSTPEPARERTGSERS